MELHRHASLIENLVWKFISGFVGSEKPCEGVGNVRMPRPGMMKQRWRQALLLPKTKTRKYSTLAE